MAGTNLEKRLKRGDPGINPLDVACKSHDIAYSKHANSEERTIADKILQNEAMKRVFSKDASKMERAAALGVAAAMKMKRKIGAGFRKKKTQKKQVALTTLIKNARNAIKKSKPEDVNSAIRVAVAAVKKCKSGKRVKNARIIKMPAVSGGVLPLIPIFAGLSALGSITSSVAGITNAIKRAKRGAMELEESKRHNRVMEATAIGNSKSGDGLYLRMYKGRGLFLEPQTKNR